MPIESEWQLTGREPSIAPLRHAPRGGPAGPAPLRTFHNAPPLRQLFGAPLLIALLWLRTGGTSPAWWVLRGGRPRLPS
jgi:hypothetical protein